MSYHYKHIRQSLMAQNKTTRFFMHVWTIWHATFFVTLIVDEMGSLCWKQIIDNEKIVEHLHASLNWKDCPMECVVLFYKMVRKFMQHFLLSSHYLLSTIKKIHNILWNSTM
jgi:hypothetical protein